jgi:hypothetical protein
MTFKQSGADVTGSFETSRGSRGAGSGVLSGSVVSGLTFQSETPNCPGSYSAFLLFSDETVKWAYKGQDCGGPVQGYGQATRKEP